MNIVAPKQFVLMAPYYGGSNGDFGVVRCKYKAPFHQEAPGAVLVGHKLYWHTCREDFATDGDFPAKHHAQFFYSHGEDRSIEQLAEFIGRFEELIGLKQRTIFARPDTQGRYCAAAEKSMTWVEVAPFWLKQDMRHSLFTSLCRCVRFYDDDKNFWQALYTYKYTGRTRSAIGRFMDGYNWYNGNHHGATGWFETFEYMERKAWANWNGVLDRPPAGTD